MSSSSRSRSLLLQLPRDILHSVYSEWLSSWRDLSCLDIACVGKVDREAWLYSLSECKIRERLPSSRLSNQSMRKWYEWVIISHKVFLIEMFPIRLTTVLTYLTTLLVVVDQDHYYDYYCTMIQSIEIEYNRIGYTLVDPTTILEEEEEEEERLTLLIRKCIHLKGIRFNGSEKYNKVNDLVLSVLRQQEGLTTTLPPNNNYCNSLPLLQSIYINIQSIYSISTEDRIIQFLTDHIMTLQDCELILDGVSEDCMDSILSSIILSPLKRLCLSVDHFSWKKLWMSLLSSTRGGGVCLETLEVEGGDDIIDDTSTSIYSMNNEEEEGEGILSMLGMYYPHLKRLRLSPSVVNISDKDKISSMKKVSQLYGLCCNLISFEYSSLITIIINNDNDRNELQYSLGDGDGHYHGHHHGNGNGNDANDQFSRDEKELFLDCLCLAIQRSQSSSSSSGNSSKILTVSNQSFCYNLIRQYDDWVLFKSKLSPYLTDLVGVMSESILIEAIKELPHLQKLDIKLDEERFSDLFLSCLIEYGQHNRRLKALYISSLRYRRAKEQYCFSDEMMSKMISSCTMLEELMIPSAGYDSILAVKYHSRLREVYLFCVEVWKEEMPSLLELDERESKEEEEEKSAWRRLRKGEIRGIGYVYNYIGTEKCWELS